MEGESEQVQGHEHGGKIGFPVPEVVFEIVAVILQDIEALVLDFPSGAAAGGEVDHRVGADLEVGDEAVAVGDGAGWLTISIMSQLTVMASASPRNGTLVSQR